MDEKTIMDYILNTFPNVQTEKAYGYDMFFYSTDRKLSFATLITEDQEYDKYSNLNRPGIYRLNIGIRKQTFQSLFGEKEVDLKAYDFTALDVVMPHPEYAQYHYICILAPSEGSFEKVNSYLTEAYDIAKRHFNSQHKSSDNA